MVDLIERQAAIDALDCINGAEEVLKALPPAQPEIIRCKDCKHNVSSHKCLHPESFFLVPSDDFYCGFAERRTDDKLEKHGKRTETHPCDLISRQAAIDAAALSAAEWDGMYVQDINGRIREALEKLPPAQPEITEEAVKEYCRKRCLCVVDGALLKKYASAQPEPERTMEEFMYGQDLGSPEDGSL